MANLLLVADTQQKAAAWRRLLRAGQRQRSVAERLHYIGGYRTKVGMIDDDRTSD